MWSNKDSIAIHFTGIRPWKANRGNYVDFTPKTVGHQKCFSLLCFYLASFNIWILFVHISGEAKIRDLHFSSFSYEDVSCCKVPVDKLTPRDADLASCPGFMHAQCLRNFNFIQPRHLNLFFIYMFLTILGPAAALKLSIYMSCIVPSSQPGTACLWKSAMQRRSGPPWLVLCRLGSQGSWSSG